MDAGLFKKDLAKLMVEAQAGNARSYDDLLSAIEPKLAGYFRRRVGESDWEDLVQATYLKLHRYRHTYVSTYPFEPWMYAIAKSVLIDQVQKDKRRLAERQGGAVDLEAIASGDITGIEGNLLETTLAKLSPDYRQAFVMTKIEGMALEDAAETLGLSLGAFKTRAHRAYKQFRTALSELET